MKTRSGIKLYRPPHDSTSKRSPKLKYLLDSYIRKSERVSEGGRHVICLSRFHAFSTSQTQLVAAMHNSRPLQHSCTMAWKDGRAKIITECRTTNATCSNETCESHHTITPHRKMAPANVVGDGAPLVIKSYNLDSGSGANALGEKPLEIYLFRADLEGCV